MNAAAARKYCRRLRWALTNSTPSASPSLPWWKSRAIMRATAVDVELVMPKVIPMKMPAGREGPHFLLGLRSLPVCHFELKLMSEG